MSVLAHHRHVMTPEEYQAARQAHQLACRPIQSELIRLAAGVTHYVDGEAVYPPEVAARRRVLLGQLDELQRMHFPLSFCSGCGRVFANCQCDD